MSDSLVDGPRTVREGEELNRDALAAYLSASLPGFDGASDLEIEQFPGGHSNLCYLLRQGKSEWVLRRPPRGSKVKAAHDMGREYKVLSKLGPAFAQAPSPILYCTDERVLGAKFYVMERLRGFILRKSFPESVATPPGLMTGMCHSMIDTLAAIHKVDYQAIGLGDLGKPNGYVQRQVTGWTERYEKAKTDTIADVDFVAKWLATHMPSSSSAALIHNDYKFDNLVLNPSDFSEIRGILDWEMTTIGDPLMDLGTALCYWVQADDAPALQGIRFAPTHLPGMLSRRQLAEHYASRTDCDLQHILFYYVFGLFKLMGVVQQIYYRYDKGLTKDPRFAGFIDAVRGLSGQAKYSIERGRI